MGKNVSVPGGAPPSGLGAKCLAAVVLAHHNPALRLGTKIDPATGVRSCSVGVLTVYAPCLMFSAATNTRTTSDKEGGEKKVEKEERKEVIGTIQFWTC